VTTNITKLWAIWCKSWAALFLVVTAVNAVFLVVLGGESIKGWDIVAAVGLGLVSIGFYGAPIFLILSGAVFGGIVLGRHARRNQEKESRE
jgi:hypothetical protein